VTRKISLFAVMLMFGSTLFAQSPAKLFLQVLNACGAGPDNNHLVWLGTTNSRGPGSIWTLPRSGPTVKYDAVPTYFKTEADLNAAIGPGNQHSNPCSGNQAPKWSVGADVPISVEGVGNGEATASLSHAKTITATAASVSFVSIPSGTLEDAINALPHNAGGFYHIADGKSYALLGAYSIQGLQITYTFDSALAVGLKTSIQATPKVNVGTATTPVTANVSISNDGQKVVISIPDAHYMFGVMAPVSMLSGKQTQDPKSRLTLGQRQWITTCRTAGLC
jgi:hypothetical protein